MKTKHTYDQVLKETGWRAPAWPLLLLALVLSLIYYFEANLLKLHHKVTKSGGQSLQVDDDVDSYWASLNEKCRNWSVKEEQNSRQLLGGFQMLNDDQMKKLSSVPQTHGRLLQGVHSYDILANPLYAQDFQYISPSLENREKFIIDNDFDESNDFAQSDMVRVALSFAYLTEQKQKSVLLHKDGFVERHTSLAQKTEVPV